jgi:ribose/xylose/arabinose/galactoside ABC-type transport system permease subunit
MKTKKFNFNIALGVLFLVLFFGIGLKAPNFFKPNYLIGVMLRNIVELGMIALPVTLITITGGIDLSLGSIATLSGITGGMVYAVHQERLPRRRVRDARGPGLRLVQQLPRHEAQYPRHGHDARHDVPLPGHRPRHHPGQQRLRLPGGRVAGQLPDRHNPHPAHSLRPLRRDLRAAAVPHLLRQIPLRNRPQPRRPAASPASTPSACENIAYIASGVMSAFAGMIMLGRFSSMKYTAGDGMNLKVVTIIVLGGTSINGGVGTMTGTIIATLIIAVLNSGLTVLNIPIDVQTIVQGTVLLISLVAYAVIDKRNTTKGKDKNAKAVKAA